MPDNENVAKKRNICVKCCCFCPCKQKPDTSESVPQIRKMSKVPYFGELPKDLKTGNVICVAAELQPTCLRFSINLTCGKGPNADIAFHLNPRLDQKYVVRNCRLNGHWGEEETTSIVKFEFPRNKNFEINIFVGVEEFMISINGRHFCAFGYRVPLVKVTGIEVHGQVEVQRVEYKEWKVYPETSENVPFTIAMGEDQTLDSDSPLPIPFTATLAKGFATDWQLEIFGRVKLLPHSFYINLQEGSHLWPHPMIPLHLNPRFNTMLGENTFVRNAWLDGCWGREERCPGFPFSPGAPFNMAIRRTDDSFSVWVDDQLTGEFKFRAAMNKINTVYIQGDVIIKQIFMSDRIRQLYLNPNVSRYD